MKFKKSILSLLACSIILFSQVVMPEALVDPINSFNGSKGEKVTVLKQEGPIITPCILPNPDTD